MNSSHWFHQWNPTHNIFDILLLCKYLPLNWYFYWADVQKAKTSQPPPPGPIWPHIYICKHPPNTARQTSAPLLDWRLLNWTFQTQHHSIFQFVSNIGPAAAWLAMKYNTPFLHPHFQWTTLRLRLQIFRDSILGHPDDDRDTGLCHSHQIFIKYFITT